MSSKEMAADFNSLMPEIPFSRRGFIVTALGAGFALAVQPVMAQTAIKTDTDGLTAGEIRVKVSDGEMAAYRAQPASGSNFPVVLVVSEIFGVHEYIADTCRRLAKLGYLAIAPELFARHGDPRKLTNIQDILTTIVAKVPDAQAMSDLDACVAWYGRLVGQKSDLTPKQPSDLAAALKAPVLGLYGGADTGIPLDTVWDMQDKLKAAGGKSEIHVYDDAPHAFHADYRPSYRKESAEDGWKRMWAWFKKNGL